MKMFKLFLFAVVGFSFGYVVGSGPNHQTGKHHDAAGPVEVHNNRGLHVRLTTHRYTAANPSAVISDSVDVSPAPDDGRPLWRITFAGGRVAYFLTEDSPK
jgi:hypothetical protein